MTISMRMIFASFRGLRHGPIASEIDHRQRGADSLGGAVLEADHGVDRDVALAAVDRVDNAGVFLVDDVAANLSRAGQFAVIGIEFLIEQEEAGNALRRRQRRVDRFDFLAQQLIYFAAVRRDRCRW